MKKKIVVSLITSMLAISILAGCGSGNHSAKYDSAASSDYYAETAEEAMDWSDYDDIGAEYNESPAEEVSESAQETKKTDRKLIRTVNMDVETYNFTDLVGKIKTKTEGMGGYIESSSVYGDEDKHNRYASFTLRVPAASADSLIETIEGGSNITSQSESVEDVTLTYVDIKSKKESLQVEYDRLEELLKDADSIDELIYIEERLAQVRYEIQSIEAQLRTYDNKVDYTTIYLSVEEVTEYTEPEIVDPTYGERLSKALKNAFTNIWEGLQNFSIFILVAIPYLIILAIPALIIFFIVRAIVRKNNEKAAKLQAEYEVKKAAAVAKAEAAAKTESAVKAEAASTAETTANAEASEGDAADKDSKSIPYSDKVNK